MSLTIELTEEQERAIAERVAKHLSTDFKEPLTVREFAKVTRQCTTTVYRHIAAGNVPTVPGLYKKLIPASHLNKFQ